MLAGGDEVRIQKSRPIQHGQLLLSMLPVVNRSVRQRLSIPVSYDRYSRATVDPATSASPGEAPRYDPIAVGDDIMTRNKLLFAHYAEG